jgi:6-phosphogluconolactonase
MSKREIQVSRNPEELKEAAADLFIKIAIEAINDHETFSVALSGGSTPRGLYSLLASEKYRSAVDWTRGVFFFGDERNVPTDSDESNYRMANETLLGPLGIDPARVHRWQTELGIDEAAVRYDAALREYLGESPHGFDLILLGLGEDAHTASLFPNTPALGEDSRFAVANFVEKLNDSRLTVTFPLLQNAANVVFLVSGSPKAEAVTHVLEGEFRPEDYPAQLVQPVNGNLFWLIDEDAASLLKAA